MRINKTVFALIGCLSILGGALSLDAAELRRYVYMIQPDGSTHGGPGSRNGILVLDVDRKFSFVNRLTTPAILKVKQGVSSGNGMRGIAVCRRTARLYYDWHQGRNPGDDGAGCIDLKTGQVVWERSYDFSCERPQVSVDGKTVFIPRHWTDTKTRKIYTLDAATGEPGRVYDTGAAWPQHPFIIHPDGKRLFFPGACLDLEGGKLLWTVERGSPVVGNCHVVLDHTGTRLYTGRHAEGNTVATWILDAETGKVAAKVPIDKQKHPDLKGISEVVAFEPGGMHFWGEADKYMVRYDNTKDPPELVALVDRDALNAAHGINLTQPKGHAMVTGAGDCVWFSNGAVLEAATGKYVCVMTAEDGKFTRGAKFLEVDFIDGEIVWAGQDESHGFLYTDYPIATVRPLLPSAGRAATQGNRGTEGTEPDRPLGGRP
jgi:hypothetical protein